MALQRATPARGSAGPWGTADLPQALPSLLEALLSHCTAQRLETLQRGGKDVIFLS